jgi:hypothetical protein
MRQAPRNGWRRRSRAIRRLAFSGHAVAGIDRRHAAAILTGDPEAQ